MSYLVIGLRGETPTPEELDWVIRPEVAGVILFARNCRSPSQVRTLTDTLRERNPALLLCIDQEGGRVQRLREPLTALPPLGRIGAVFEQDSDAACRMARAHGELMAHEVLALGVDLSLAPVLDLDAGCSVIGDRAFHTEPATVAALASQYVTGMRRAGMRACGKHFPGHGSVVEDTHVAVAIDQRRRELLERTDLLPFQALVRDGLDALMMAHVCYSAVCPSPAGYSPRWIGDILRGELGFDGVVISDDLGMRAAHDAGSLSRRAEASLAAGCDLVLVCGADDVAALMAEGLPGARNAEVEPAAALRAADFLQWRQFENSERRAQLRAILNPLQSTQPGAAH